MSLFHNAALAAIASLGLCACSSTEQPEPAPVELQEKTEARFDLPEQALIDQARRLYLSGLFTIAREYFTALRDNYPLGAYGEYAEIKIADCYYYAGEHLTAATLYEEFSKNRPSSASHPYAVLMTGVALQNSAGGIGRDISPHEKALTYFRKVIGLYPDSPYSAAARAAQHQALEAIATHEQRIIDFYRARNTPAAEVREARYAQNLAPELQEAERSRVAFAQPIAMARLKLPDSALMQPAMASNVQHDESGASKNKTTIAEGSNSVRLLRANCKDGSVRQVYLTISREVPPDQLPASIESSSENRSLLKFRLPITVSNGVTQNYDCFGSSDLSVAPDGTVALRNVTGADLIALRNPARLLLTIR